ncbi:flagellar biogenesis protein [Alkalihalobacillus pseudalcaliphilus]|nr:flagellar biogenesis protein [Alkalihalobacillus pseudalcaliphilus]
MDLKEREKKEGQSMYAMAVQDFEQKATVLYNLLKTKETLEADARERIVSGILIRDIQQQESQFLRLQNEINQQQQKTNMARHQMQLKQHELMERTVEFKKYEKMKNIKRSQFVEEQKQSERKMMDELSTMMYAKR